MRRAPFTAESVLGWVYASRAASGGENIGWEGRSFGMGVYTGVDEMVHWEVDNLTSQKTTTHISLRKY